jgi:hypothetical protein
MPADVTIAGQKVKAIPLPMVPPNIKKVGVHFGIIGDYLVITTTKEAMEKAAAIAGDAGKALTSTPLYKDCIDGTGFLSFFVNAAELTRLQKIAKMMAPGAADIDELPAFQKGLGIAASFSGDTIKLMMGQKLDMQMAMDFAIKTLKKKFPAPKK